MDDQNNSSKSFLSKCASLEGCLERYESGEENYPYDFFFNRFGNLTAAFAKLPNPEKEDVKGVYELIGFEVYQVLRNKGYREKFPQEIQHIVGISGVYEYPEE